MGQVIGLKELIEVRENARRQGLKFVFTNGCFDILHRGHIELLRSAKALGDILVVAVNSDASVKRIKGELRPIVKQEDRAEILACLVFVDYVIIFDGDTPEAVITELLPDVLVKGSDYKIENIVGRKQVESTGGRVVRVPLVSGYSTESMLSEIVRRYGKRR